jgi:hypothetical protein
VRRYQAKGLLDPQVERTMHTCDALGFN